MLKKKLLVAALASSFSLAALADEHTFTGNVGFTSRLRVPWHFTEFP